MLERAVKRFLLVLWCYYFSAFGTWKSLVGRVKLKILMMFGKFIGVMDPVSQRGN